MRAVVAIFIVLACLSSAEKAPCFTNSDCLSHQICGFEQLCDEDGCQKSQFKTCQDFSMNDKQFEKSVLVQNFVQSLSEEAFHPQVLIRSSLGKDALVTFEKKSHPESKFSIGLKDQSQDFVFRTNDIDILSIDTSTGTTRVFQDLYVSQEFKLGLQSSFLVNGVKQWLLVHEELGDSFELSRWEDTSGAELKLTDCGGAKLLGGYGQLSFQKLQTRISLDKYQFSHIKVEATFHFIDAWAGQMAYLQLLEGGGLYVWTDSHDFTQSKSALNVCGSEVGEGKFSQPIEVVVEKKRGVDAKNQLGLEFGTTLDTDPFYASFGISTLRVYLR